MWWKARKTEPKAKAIAYYRHSAQDRQENSIPIQREQVHEFAAEHGIDIVREFADHGKSGLSTEGRDGFNEALALVGEPDSDFQYVLVLDVSRWGRFQDIDMSAHYRALCKMYGKQVVYTSKGFPRTSDPIEAIQLSLEAYRAAEYSRELSEKVFKGCVKIVRQGFHAGGHPPYGLSRLLLDEQRHPVQVLKVGQRKSIQNQRVTLTAGRSEEIAVVQRVFTCFVKRQQTPAEIAQALNEEGVPSPGAREWSSAIIRNLLSNELYVGTMVYNKTTQRLQSPSKRNPEQQWIRTANAFEGIIRPDLFQSAQEILMAEEEERRRKYSEEDMLLRLRSLYERLGFISCRQIAMTEEMVSPTTYASRFLSLDMAFQKMFPDVLAQTKRRVLDRLGQMARNIEEHEGYHVLNECVSIVIQPSVPIPCGYHAYWPFLPDPRIEVDITLGVPLSNSGEYRILGYLPFARMLVAKRGVRVFSSSDAQLELHGYQDLELIEEILN